MSIEPTVIEQGVSMPWSSSHEVIQCEMTGLDHVLSVDLPARYDQLEAPPVIVCLDGPWLFGTMADAVRIMSTSREAPEAIVVGVSFAEPKVSEYMRQRARWYTPTPWNPPPEAGVKGVEASECGRADEFRAFVENQLLPLLAEGYRFGERWFAGHSFSALFGLHTMLQTPDLFDRWMLFSPSIWWDDRVILDAEEAFAAASEDLSSELFISVGSAEDDNSTAHLFAMRANAEELVRRLTSRGYDSLRLHQTLLDGGTHSSCIGQAVAKGLRAFHRGEI